MDSSGSPAECPWMRRPYSKLPSVPTMLTRELEDFITFLNPTPEEHNVRALVFERIKRAIKDLWNTADVKVFGSFETQLYLPSSDMDVVVLLGREINKYKDLQNLRNHLRRSGVGENITCIAKARVPIVKFQETYSHISVDVSFNQVSGIEGAEVVKNYMTKTPGLRSLTMLIKQFLMANELNEVYLGGIGSYATVIMVLSFLQRHPAVQAGLINPDKNLGVLLIEFFELYGLHFNYQDVGIDVAGTGKYFPVTNRENNGHRHIRLVTLDPINADNNVTKGSIKVLEIRKLFAQAYERLTRNSREQHRDIFVDNERAGRGEISLLRGVLSIPERVMSQRYLLEKVYIQGHLQALLKRY
ncbi:hypothetical protein BC939DRAFT_402689 [Gamsiella multidivaricata]|uniref:uncharacterized protein n=1 Tax=Gamsiella multidivaricata TaxID=101098 RepID=UPI0022208F0D|nr:uncharacterized protein BC939DRAFT_402689 [Gamsiella multidivaricata]KAI7817386.1 hypothetical protein BC939DRAFT_402689 [Gamsiella multidivaricata]